MCIAILQNENSFVTRRELTNCWNNNNDGAGLIWIENHKLKIHKELFNFKHFYKKYRWVTTNFGKESKVVIHFRYATHGHINLKNCHPFLVNPNLAFVHNGIIDIDTSEKKSDTLTFNNEILKKLPKNFMEFPGIIKLIDKYVDSKIIFLTNKNTYHIIGIDGGHWHNGCWFSNYDHCFPVIPYKNYNYQNYGKGFIKDKDKTLLKNETSTHSKVSYFNKHKSYRVTGECDRCKSEGEIKLFGRKWYCEYCLKDMLEYENQNSSNTICGICHECGLYEEGLYALNDNFYCKTCYSLLKHD